MRECIECGTAFDAAHHNTKMCSVKCKQVRQNALRRATRKADCSSPPEKKCVVCSTAFRPANRNSKLCSVKCRRVQRRTNPANYPPKTCLRCCHTFQPSKGNWAKAKYCTPTCRTARRVDENKRIGRAERVTIKCKECGMVTKPTRIDGTTCGKRHCVDESRRKTKIENDAKAVSKGGHRYENYRKYQNAYRKKKAKYRTDPKYNLSARMRGALRQALKRKGLGVSAKNAPTFTLLGYSREELYCHIESFFTEENGYSWDNMDEWHIDHIRPISSFEFNSTDDPEFKACWALDNLQPLWAPDNLSKGAKWEGLTDAEA